MHRMFQAIWLFIFLRRWWVIASARLRYLAVRRSFYSPDIRAPQRLGDGLQSWFGFYQSIRPTQMGLSLNIGETLPVS
jgi:hypothetical protein